MVAKRPVLLKYLVGTGLFAVSLISRQARIFSTTNH